MYRTICCSSVRPLRSRNKFDALSVYGGSSPPAGLSFDPTDTHALLRALNALQSTGAESRRACCSGHDSPPQSSAGSCSSSSDKSSGSSDSHACPSTIPAQSSATVSSEAVQTCSSTFSSQQGASDQGFAQDGGVGTSGGVTWIDWGWPGTHTPCPFNQRHTVDDILIRPKRNCCERWNGIVCTFCPLIGKLVRCCKLRMRQLGAAVCVTGVQYHDSCSTLLEAKQLFGSMHKKTILAEEFVIVLKYFHHL